MTALRRIAKKPLIGSLMPRSLRGNSVFVSQVAPRETATR